MPRRTPLVSATVMTGLVCGLVGAPTPASGADGDVARISTRTTSVQDAAEQVWDADRGFVGGTSVPRLTTAAIAGTTDDALYQSERYGMSAYRIRVPASGSYAVTLRMAENYFSAARQRVFDVSAEGRYVLHDVDVFAAVGRHRAYDRTVVVPVTDGVLDLGFRHDVDFATVSAIRVAKATGTTPTTPTPPAPTTPPAPPAPPGTAVRLVAGTAAVKDLAGNTWKPDGTYARGSSGLWKNAVPIAGTSDDALFQTERWGLTGYRIPLARGTYRVTLNEAEIYFTGTGQRVFSVSAEGRSVAKDVDIVRRVGARSALRIGFDVTVTDGALDLTFTKQVDDPKVASLSVLATGATPPTPPPTTPTPPTPPTPTPPTPTSPTTGGKITRSGNAVLRNGRPWWFVGHNSFVWSGNCGGSDETLSAAQVDAWFASLRHDGHAAVRLFFFRGWNTSRLDAALASAKKHNVYLTITLDDAIGGCGENDKTEGWFGNRTERADFRAHMVSLLNRYKGENQIAWFEYFNEPGGNGTWNELRDFYDEMGDVAHGVDPSRLFSSGTVAPYWLGDNEGSLNNPNFRAVSASRGVDIVSLHEYDMGEVASNHLDNVVANSAGKPVIAGEYGITASRSGSGCGNSYSSRARKLVAKGQAYVRTPGTVGGFVWAWTRGHGSDCTHSTYLDDEALVSGLRGIQK